MGSSPDACSTGAASAEADLAAADLADPDRDDVDLLEDRDDPDRDDADLVAPGSAEADSPAPDSPLSVPSPETDSPSTTGRDREDLTLRLWVGSASADGSTASCASSLSEVVRCRVVVLRACPLGTKDDPCSTLSSGFVSTAGFRVRLTGASAAASGGADEGVSEFVSAFMSSSMCAPISPADPGATGGLSPAFKLLTNTNTAAVQP